MQVLMLLFAAVSIAATLCVALLLLQKTKQNRHRVTGWVSA